MSALFPVLSTLYISPIFYIFEKIINNLHIPIPISFLSFVNDGLFISQKKILWNQILTFFPATILSPYSLTNLD